MNAFKKIWFSVANVYLNLVCSRINKLNQCIFSCCNRVILPSLLFWYRKHMDFSKKSTRIVLLERSPMNRILYSGIISRRPEGIWIKGALYSNFDVLQNNIFYLNDLQVIFSQFCSRMLQMELERT